MIPAYWVRRLIGNPMWATFVLTRIITQETPRSRNDRGISGMTIRIGERHEISINRIRQVDDDDAGMNWRRRQSRRCSGTFVMSQASVTLRSSTCARHFSRRAARHDRPWGRNSTVILSDEIIDIRTRPTIKVPSESVCLSQFVFSHDHTQDYISMSRSVSSSSSTSR